jgi:hypothetical protein
MKSTDNSKRWFQVPEAWLILGLLTASVLGSGVLIAAALDYPDAIVAAKNSATR